MEFKDLSLKEIIAKIKSGETTQKEVYEYFLARIDKINPTLDSFNFINKEFIEKDINSPLAWVPIWVKDLFSEKWVLTTASSKMLKDYKAPYDSTVIVKLKEAWFNSIGKLNLDEFAMGWSWENSGLRISKNPWDITRIPGWSSSGSASAVASGMVPAALGTDTGWSIRQPASMCGIVGFKPTYGRTSRYWVIPMASSLDTMGTFTKTVEDAGLLFEIMAWFDPNDSTSINKEVKIDPSIWDKKDLKWIKVWVPKEYFIDWMEKWVTDEINKAIEKIKELGAEIVEVSLPHTEYGLPVYYIVCPAEVSTNMSRYDTIRFGSRDDEGLSIWDAIAKNRSEFIWKEVQRRIMLGTFVLSAWFYDAYYNKASLVRELLKDDFRKVFEQVDVIVAPTAPTVAWKLGDRVDDPLKMYLSDVFTVNWSLAWLPWLTLPCWYAKSEDEEQKELPVWLQILGPELAEEKVFMVGHVFEQAVKDYVNSKKPEIY